MDSEDSGRHGDEPDPQVPAWARRARSKWRYSGQGRPPFAVTPEPGQESVWDYPRPPRIEAERREAMVRFGDTELARSRLAVRVLETASPPTVYLPAADVRMELLEASPTHSICEWKGEAQYWAARLPGAGAEPVAWSYVEPLPGFEQIRGWLSFYPSRLECYLDGARVDPQPGQFYGGWVTPELVGPFKGEPGSEAW